MGDFVCTSQREFLTIDQETILRRMIYQLVKTHGKPGTVRAGEEYKVDEDYRNNSVYFLNVWDQPDDCPDPLVFKSLFYLIAGFAVTACETTFKDLGIQLTNIAGTPLQLGCYFPGQYYQEHSDSGGGNDRQFSVCLTVSAAYSGGELIMSRLPADSIAADTIKQSRSVVGFPSEEQHRVSKVDAGERISVVAWFRGTRTGA